MDYNDYLQNLVKHIESVDPDDVDEDLDKSLSSLGNADLMMLRGMLPADNKKVQNFLSPYEHRAFAREYTAENPVSGTIGLAVATPVYYGAKLMGLAGGRSDPSLAQMAAGYQGIGQGLAQYFTR